MTFKKRWQRPFPLPSKDTSNKESSERILQALLITQISKDDYADFNDFSMCFVSV
jgi:hypothetical protein